MVEREEVEAMLQACKRDRIGPHPDNDTLAALCRAWLAVQDAPIVLANEWIWEHVPESLEGQRVRIVPEPPHDP